MQDETAQDIEEQRFLIDAATTTFRRNREGRVIMTDQRGEHTVSNMSLAFPLSNQAHLIVVRNNVGSEIGILDSLRKLTPDSRTIVDSELERTYFMPVVTDITDVTENLGLVTWKLVTDRGPRSVDVRNVRRNLRRMGRNRILIKDVDGNRYDIPNRSDLPPRAQSYLERYL